MGATRSTAYYMKRTVWIVGGHAPGRFAPIPEPPEEKQVDAEFVENYTSLQTREFFTNLGGTERMSRDNKGVIRCKSVSPDGRRTTVTIFTPIRD